MSDDCAPPPGDPFDKRPPLKRIAEVLGISKMTVSRALREGTSVGEELRARVHEVARQIGYQPDSRISQVMSAIRKSQTPVYRETLALIGTHRRTDKDVSHYFFDGIFAGASRRAQQLGFRLDDFRTTDQTISGRALSRILHTRGIRGVLIAPPNPERAHPHVWLDWKKFCCVLIGRSFANTGIPRVQPDHYLSCVLAMRRLRRLRYRRIALVLSHSMDERTVRMARAAFLSFHPLGLHECEKLIFTSDDPRSETACEMAGGDAARRRRRQFRGSFPAAGPPGDEAGRADRHGRAEPDAESRARGRHRPAVVADRRARGRPALAAAAAASLRAGVHRAGNQRARCLDRRPVDSADATARRPGQAQTRPARWRATDEIPGAPEVAGSFSLSSRSSFL